MGNNSVYTLKEIAEWAVTNQVSLPTVQRGFVWKPSQIENLWDSLLRGYPVGAFVLAKNDGRDFEILDGQQRATAICLGFSKKTFRDSQDNIKVFIDLEKADTADSRKYIFRVLTRSHPWGYRRSENNKALTSDNIRKSMDLYDTTDPLTTDLENFYPFDADFPVPYYFFINAVVKNQEVEQLHSTIIEWQHYNKIYQKWKDKSVNEKKTEEVVTEELLGKISNIFTATVEMLADETGQKIPALYLNLDKFLKDDESKDEEEKGETADEIENLFVRLNAGGTQLTGEELNYSILKAHLQRETQETIEEACKDLFRPSRFITVAYRLFQQTPESDQRIDALTMRIKPKQFQRSISKNVHNFEVFLIDICTDKKFCEKTLLEYTKDVLAFDNQKRRYGLPFVIYSKIAEGAPEVMYLLMYRIYFKKDRFPIATNYEQIHHKKVLGIITLFYWFGKGENYKDHSKLLSNIWLAASTLNSERFWSSETIERASLNNALIPFPSYDSDVIHKEVLNRINEKSNITIKFQSIVGQEYGTFFDKISFNKDLIMYAQRNFIENYFKQQQYRLEDTNVPFDWDHIAPNNWIKNKKNIPKVLKDWYQSNGNYRAWPYALNRMDSDNSPKSKLNPLDKENGYSNAVQSVNEKRWNSFIDLNNNLITNVKEIPNKLIEWSFCEVEWAKCGNRDIKKQWTPVAKLILKRNFLLIKEWYDQLLMEDLKQTASFSFESIFLKSKWKELSKNDNELDELVIDVDFRTWISNNISVGNTKLRFYFYYDGSDFGYLEENSIGFGIYQKNGGDFIKQLSENSSEIMDRENYIWLENNFSLVSSHQNAIVEFLNDLITWINQLQYSDEEKQELCVNLKNLIPKKFNFMI